MGGRGARRVIGGALREDLDDHHRPGGFLIIVWGCGLRRGRSTRAAGPSVLNVETTIGEVLKNYERNKSEKIGKKCERAIGHTLFTLVRVA